jgi:GntR family transcriptional regulator, sialic acid-inducible nan operon repressor
MTSSPEPILKRKLSADVEDRLLALIRGQGLAPGTTLPSERELMAKYQVGRPAIREAMQNLQRMGMVEVRHGERPQVSAPSMDKLLERMGTAVQHLLTHSASSMDHLKEARATFEIEMARMACDRRSVADVQDLHALLAMQNKAIEEPALFISIDGKFHRRIAAISRNPIFEAISASVFEWLTQFRADLVRLPGHEQHTLREHAAILAAIEAGDGVSAARAMRDHLNRTSHLYASSIAGADR